MAWLLEFDYYLYLGYCILVIHCAMRFISYLKNFDWVLFSVIILLISFGLVEIYSIAIGQKSDDAMLNFKKQIFFVVIGVSSLFIFSFINYHHLRNLSNYIYFFGMMSLIAVLLFGQEVNGTRGWFNFGKFSLQPVEFVKIVLILFLSRYFSRFSFKINTIKHFIITGAGAFLLFFLVLGQPDLGSAFLLFFIWFVFIFIAGLEKKYILGIFLIIFISSWIGWTFYFKDYQKQRILTFLNPKEKSLSEGYNVNQAMIAVGAGKLAGSGVGFGTQSQLRFLPESQNDFIFAVIAEEFGFVGVIVVLFLFIIFFYRCLLHIRNIDDDFGIFFIVSAVCLIFIEMFINIGMNLGIVPVIGISLPFISYGGSAMVANLIMLGIVENIIIRAYKKIS